jgi:WD40 repeat protein
MVDEPAAVENLQQQLREACAALERSLYAGEEGKAEAWFKAYPALATHKEAALELVYAEFVCREQLNQRPTPQQWYLRFPDWRVDLEQLFQVHQLAKGTPQFTTEDGLPAELGLSGRGIGAVNETGIGPGKRVGNYELLEEIGRGGMGVVFRARQVGLDRIVALKMILAGEYASLAELGRFRREAEAAARLQHRHIVQIHEVGQEAGRPFFSLEFVDGGSLDKRLARKPLPFREAASLIETLARAVHFAHQHGIIHRDLKPANVLLTTEGEPRITDFGLAKRLEDGTGPTQTGVVLGTPSYMAPEQAACESKEIGPATDVYALGAILYEALTGRPPFQAATLIDTLDQVRSQEVVPPRSLQAKLPRDLETICLKCLEKDHNRRYETANGLAMDLRRFLTGEPVQACPPSTWYRLRKSVHRNKGPVLAAALVFTVLTVGIVGTSIGLIRALNAERLAGDRLAEVQEANIATSKAFEETKVAKNETDKVLKKVERSLYFQSIARAHLEWWDNDVGRADQILDECPAEYRQWEWRHLKRLCRGELFAFRADAFFVRVAFSPDGSRIAASSADKSVKILDLATGRELFKLRGHTEVVRNLAFSPDGGRLASASGRWDSREPGQLKIWNLANGNLLLDLTGHTAEVNSVAFGPDGRILVSGSLDGTIKLWDGPTGREIRTIRSGHRGGVKSVAISPDGKHIASGGWGGLPDNLKIWTPADGRARLTLPLHQGDVVSVAFSPDSRRLVSTSWDGTAAIWDAETGRMLHRLLGHTDVVQKGVFSPDGQTVATASTDATVKLWDTSQGREIQTLRGHTGAVYGVSFSPGGRALATASWDQTVKVWDLTNVPPSRTLLSQSGSVRSNHAALAFSPDGKLLAAGGRQPNLSPTGHIRTWYTDTGQPASFQVFQPGGFESLALSVDGRWVAADCGSAVKVWDAQTGRENWTLKGHASQVTAVAISSDGRRLASGSQDQTLKVWDLTSGKLLLTLTGHTKGVTSVVFHPNGKYLASGSQDGSVRMWDTSDGRAAWTSEGHTGAVNAVAFSPNGRHLASGGDDKTVRIWETQRGQTVLTVTGHLGPVMGLDYSADGQRLASASPDGSVRIWDTLNGQEALTLRGQSSGFWRVVFSPDGRRLAASSQVNAITIWDTAEEIPSDRQSRVLAWHELEAEGFESRRDWRSAVSHLDCVIETKPADAMLCLRRARVHAALRQWDQAAADYTRAFPQEPPKDPAQWYEYACTRLLTGQAKDFRRLCAERLEQLDPKDPRDQVHFHVVRACTLVPNAVPGDARLARWAELMLAHNPTAYWLLILRGAVHCRSGEYDKAIPLLLQSNHVDPKADARCLSWLWLAIAYHQLGKAEEARKWYRQAVTFLDCYERGLPLNKESSVVSLHLYCWLEAAIIRREAEGLLMGK